MTSSPPRIRSTGWAWPFRCGSCGRVYPERGMPHRCPVCGGLFDFASPITYAPPSGPTRRRTGLARYRASLPVPPGGPLVSLGEGGTPLIPIRVGGEPVYLKCEHLNPTGSFKDRGTAVLVSALAAVGVDRAVEDSSGNAGASLAAYAARAGIRVKIYIPASAAGVKREQIRAYGAEVVPVPGPRSQVTETLLREAEEGVAYASHATLPHSLAGMATLAFELVEQLGQAPGSLIMPVGQGTLLLGAHLGFQAMVRAGVIERGPQLIGVQARRCAPIWAAYTGGASGLALVREGETAAEGVRILVPLRGDAVMEAVRASGGWMEAVEEEDIWIGVEVLAGRGFLVEPTSAVVWPAIEAALGRARAPLVAVLTGSGYKDLRRWTTGRDDRAGPDR